MLSRIKLRVWGGLIALLGACAGVGAAEKSGAHAYKATLSQYCLACHTGARPAGGLPLDVDAPIGSSAPTWEKVVWKLRHRQMPPLGLPRPSESEYEKVVSTLIEQLDHQAAAHPSPGRTDTFRRLTRFEYRNAVRDLLALDVDADDLLPKDESSGGFDNITVGSLSPTLLERYLSAARKVSRLAVGTPLSAPTGRTVLIPPDLTQEDHVDALPLGTRGGAVIEHTFPRDGEYEIRLRLARDRNEKIEGLYGPTHLDLLVDDKPTETFTVAPPPRGEQHHNVDRDLRIRMRVAAGPHEIGATFAERSGALLETVRKPYEAAFNMDRHPRPRPALYSITITGPFEQFGAGETPSRKRIFRCRPEAAAEQEACAEQILRRLMRRAYRRPVDAADLEAPLGFYRTVSAEDGFEAGVETALRAVLTSPHFLFRIEPDPAGVASGEAYEVSDLALASRLSFFLWSSIPDEELLDAAVAGRLSEPDELERQVRRMLADPRSSALVESFASQWLYLRNLETARPDPRLFPDFDENLRQALRRETELLFESVMREDRNVLDLLRADYTFLNERLAKHYGIPHIYGSHFRRVSLSPDTARGGLLTQGSVLTVTSYATRTSPVIRGKWVLDNILGTPPPPPPPNVPQLEEKKQPGKELSIRELMALHRDNPACSACHQVMDPVGFAFERFDAVGRRRAAAGGVPVDASGGLPDGTTFDGVAELQRAVLRNPDLFVTTLTNKLLTYALGRGVEPTDAAAVRRIVRDAAADDYRFSQLVLGIVRSVPFRMREAL